MSILVIGESCNDEYVYGRTTRLAPEAPVPVLQPLWQTNVGGMSMNVLENLKALKAHADIVTNWNWETIVKRRYIDSKTNQMIVRVDTNDAKYGRINLSNIEWNDYHAIIISDYDKGFVTEEDIQTISTKHSLVFLDTKKVLGSWAEKVAFIKINNFEYEATKHTITPKLQQRLIITMGGEGCLHGGVQYQVPDVDVKDTCGAGDTFIASLTYEYLNTKSIAEAIKFANKCATQVIQKKGTSKIDLKKL